MTLMTLGGHVFERVQDPHDERVECLLVNKAHTVLLPDDPGWIIDNSWYELGDWDSDREPEDPDEHLFTEAWALLFPRSN
jgi:hypothetical protein